MTQARRAIPRDLLTGAPIAADAIVRRVRVDNPPDRSTPRRSYRLSTSSSGASSDLPTLAYIEDADGDADDE